jgi:TolB protein
VIRTLQHGQRCEVWIASVTGERELVFTSEDLLLEAPNWTLDGGALILNGAGKLWRLETAGSTSGPGASLKPVPLTGIPDLNNDHVLAPDGTGIYLSANDGHIYRAPLDGGRATKITDDDGFFHFLHGVSPNGQELAYVGIEAGDFTQPGKLMTIPASGGATTPLTVDGHCDGPEYSPGGEWLYFNTEAFTSHPATPSLPGSRPQAPPPAVSSGPRAQRPSSSWRAAPSTGSRISPPTHASPATSVSRVEPSDTPRT